MSETTTYALALAGIGIATGIVPYFTKGLLSHRNTSEKQAYEKGLMFGSLTGIAAAIFVSYSGLVLAEVL